MTKYLSLLFWLIYSAVICAQPDGELDFLCRRANESGNSKDYFNVCSYFIDHNSPSEVFLEYLDKGYRAALKERNAVSVQK